VPALRARELVVGGRGDRAEALALLSYYVAERASVTRVDEIEIP
jgi:hypothetical protein